MSIALCPAMDMELPASDTSTDPLQTLNLMQALRARMAVRDSEVEALRGRVVGAGALSASEKRQAGAALEAAAAQLSLLERQLSEAQAKV